MTTLYPPYLTLEKAVGETPLSCAEAYRLGHPELIGVPLAYAGRLDPMASGKLLILVGDECKKQSAYHNLDKEYEFSVLFGISSDTEDVLGRLQTGLLPNHFALGPNFETTMTTKLQAIAGSLIGPIELPYPIFSSKTVRGKPLHTWALEGRLAEIDVPKKQSSIYQLSLNRIENIERAILVKTALDKINTIPPVTEASKAIGKDFRRTDIRADWEAINNDRTLPKTYTIAHFSCLASSGTYMRTLASVIAQKIGTNGLAWHIHRSKIGRFNAEQGNWSETF